MHTETIEQQVLTLPISSPAPEVSIPAELDESEEDFDFSEADYLRLSPAEREELDRELDRLIEAAKPLPAPIVPTVTRPDAISTDEGEVMPKPTASLIAAIEHSLDTLTIDNAKDDPILQENLDVVRTYLLSDDFPGLRDPAWTMRNPARLHRHAMATLALESRYTTE